MSERRVIATTGCQQAIDKPCQGEIIEAGISGWTDDITCPICLARIGLALPTPPLDHERVTS